jgi:hypothetical protein
MESLMHFVTRLAILIWLAFFAWIVTVLIVCLLGIFIGFFAFSVAFFIGSCLIGYAASWLCIKNRIVIIALTPGIYYIIILITGDFHDCMLGPISTRIGLGLFSFFATVAGVEIGYYLRSRRNKKPPVIL